MKTIYMLGSGSSIGHSNGRFPSIDGFFSVANELGLYGSGTIGNIQRYVNSKFGIDIHSKRSRIDIEAVFTLIEIEIERRPSPELLAIRLELLKLIQRVLIILEEQLPKGKGEYYDFLGKLDSSNSHTIITFNWDIMFDNVLARTKTDNGDNFAKEFAQQHEKYMRSLSAITETSSWGEMTTALPYDKWDPEQSYYLKAHGSIDWLYCSNEACSIFSKIFPAKHPGTTYYCSECHEQLEFLIIPPVLNKGYRQYPAIRRIWNVAAKEMESAANLVIWGYSLPPTDFYAAWLLRMARQAPLEKITIINPEVVLKNKSKVNLRISFIRKFFDIFRDKIGKDNLFLYETHTDYYNNQSVFDKYLLKNKTEAYKNI